MKIATYVMSKYAKQTYAHESHDVRAWPGFEMVLDSIRRAGYNPEYAGRATVHNYDVVLISITSDCDWWPFMAERARWKAGSYLIIAGGAGVLNVRPYLSLVHSFVLGRGEKILPAILAAHARGERHGSQSVIWSDSFNVDRRYELAQADTTYPHSFTLTNGRTYLERSIGCPNKCLFCGYTWHRRYIGDGTYAAGSEAMGGRNVERTIIDLLKLPPAQWQEAGQLRIVGLDGMSERLRRKANKQITREMFKEFLRGLSQIERPNQIKVYAIIGYPGESDEDWYEFISDLEAVDRKLQPSNHQWSILLHLTPFRAMPGTPAACWPMSLRNYRGAVAKTLKRREMPGNVFYQGTRFWAVEGMGTDSLPTVILSAACLRGTEEDTEIMMRIAGAPKFWNANARPREATLRSALDVERLFREYTWTDLPTRYIRPSKTHAVEREPRP